MPRNSLIAALAMLAALHVASGASAAERCKDYSDKRELCEKISNYEREGFDCFPCRWYGVSKSCERGTVGWCPNAYYRFGDTGTAVTKMQEALKKKSFDVDVTGKFDERTKKAIESFQKQHSIFKDGIAGPETLGRLKQ